MADVAASEHRPSTPMERRAVLTAESLNRPAQPTSPESVLALQSTAGNRITTVVLQRAVVQRWARADTELMRRVRGQSLGDAFHAYLLETAGPTAGWPSRRAAIQQAIRDQLVALVDRKDRQRFEMLSTWIASSRALVDDPWPARVIAHHQRMLGLSAEVEGTDTSDQGEPRPTGMPSARTLTEQIANSIGVWETNRGGTTPRPRESALDTVSGVSASMASTEQATMEYALGKIRRFPALRSRADPPLSTPEITAGLARCRAVHTLLARVSSAVADGTTPETFISERRALIAPTGLSDDHVMTMFRAVHLRTAIDAQHAEIESRRSTASEAAAQIPEADRLGLGEASVRAYIKQPRKWGENRAAWKRLAVDLMPNQVGRRVNQVATADDGTAIVGLITTSRVNSELARTPPRSVQQIVEAVGRQNNPGEPSYGGNIWATYRRLYLSP